MNTRHFVAAMVLMLAAGATFAALQHAPVESQRTALPAPAAVDCMEPSATAIPRVVVTARRDTASADETPIARVVVAAKRIQAGATVASAETR